LRGGRIKAGVKYSHLVVSKRSSIKLITERINEMKTNTLIAIILIAVGIVAFAYQGITYTSKEKVVDLGPVQVTAEKTRTFPLPPIVGGIALVGGIVLLLMGSKKA
jgi:uncharacterized membrane protein YidH (DUF202 family)